MLPLPQPAEGHTPGHRTALTWPASLPLCPRGGLSLASNGTISTPTWGPLLSLRKEPLEGSWPTPRLGSGQPRLHTSSWNIRAAGVLLANDTGGLPPPHLQSIHQSQASAMWTAEASEPRRMWGKRESSSSLRGITYMSPHTLLAPKGPIRLW